MVKSKGYTTGSNEVGNIYDTVGQNCIRIVDEFVKTRPQYTQSASNLQLQDLTDNILDIAQTESLNKQMVNIDTIILDAVGDITKDQVGVTDDVKLLCHDVNRKQELADNEVVLCIPTEGESSR